MKWTIQQLRKIQTFPYAFSDTIDFTTAIQSVADILGMDEVHVVGHIYRIDEETYRFLYQFDVSMRLECALTLEPVSYEHHYTYDEVYSLVEKEDAFLIEKNTIDLSEMVWSNILIEKPINVTLPNAHEILKERGIILDDTLSIDDDNSDEVLFYSDGLDEDED
ncbi:MAG: hypothetical protein NC090_07320 [Anaeroplasma bactoclasticum]|nr:hypothetical protein [Anaeroplasma bactoclasticum]